VRYDSIAAVLLISLGLVSLAFRSGGTGEAASPDTPSVLVQVTQLREGSLPKYVTVFGKVEASAAMQQNITAPATALVQEIFVKPGQQVNAGANLIKLGPTPGTAAAYKKAQTALNSAQQQVLRTKALLAAHLATRQQLANAETAVADAQATLAALAAEGGGTPQTLSAPYKAVVTSISASIGAVVNQGVGLLMLARSNGLILRAGAVPEQAEEIHSGDKAQVTALGGGDAGAGTVLLRGSIVDPNSGLVPVEITLPQGEFLSGQMAQARIAVGLVTGYVVPHEAVLVNDQGLPYVVQAKNQVAHLIPVKILLSAGAKDVISGALDPAAALVLAGNYQLTEGMRVRVTNPNASDPQ
jgi:membrane fusion protein (multidrug efflux system)